MESFFFIHNETSVTAKNGNIIYCKCKIVKKEDFCEKGYIAGLSVIVLLIIGIAISAVAKFQDLEQVVQQKTKKSKRAKAITRKYMTT